MNLASDLNCVNQFLALDTFDESLHYDMILVLGNAVADVALKGYELYRKGYSDYFMIAGGRGHTTDILESELDFLPHHLNETKSEGYLLKKYIESIYGHDNTILLEEASTNCGENIFFTFEIIRQNQLKIENILLCHDPLMQRRIDATAKKQFPNIHFHNYASFIPEVLYEDGNLCLVDKVKHQWTMERYLSLMLGEMKRLIDNSDGYGPNGKGYIVHIDIPILVYESYQNILKKYSYYLRD